MIPQQEEKKTQHTTGAHHSEQRPNDQMSQALVSVETASFFHGEKNTHILTHIKRAEQRTSPPGGKKKRKMPQSSSPMLGDKEGILIATDDIF